MMGNLEADEVEDILRNGVVGRIGFVDDGWPCVVPVTYVYDGAEWIYFHSAEGEKVTAIREDRRVCFEVEQLHGMSNWQTVRVRGCIEPVARDPDERVMDLLAQKFAWAKAGQDHDRHEDVHRREGLVRPLVFRIHIVERSGRFELS